MRTQTSAAEYVPSTGGLPVLREAVQECRGCDLYLHASHAVFGEGPRSASVVFVGEQPGDEEDRQGRPFVGRLPPGSRVDRYQILGAVGRGGMGDVYAAYHPDLDRRNRPDRGARGATSSGPSRKPLRANEVATCSTTASWSRLPATATTIRGAR